MRTALTAGAIRTLEEPHLAAGVPLMERAAGTVAAAVEAELRATTKDLTGTRVLVLVGPGANGGDALLAAARLASTGVRVVALTVGDSVHPPGLYAARTAGVDLRSAPGSAVPDVPEATDVPDLVSWSELIVDGMLGIGATGGLRGPARAVAETVLAGPRRTVVAVDVPSGIGVDDGTLPGPVLHADVTVTMIAAKPGILLPPAAGRAGRIEVSDIGVAPTGEPAVVEPGWAEVARSVHTPSWEDDKYSRGVLGVVAGSETYPGAAVLTVAGALRTGVGMVRHLADRRSVDLVLAAHPEVVGADGRVQALVVGPGTADGADRERLSAALERALRDGTPTVVDAGALPLVTGLDRSGHGVTGDLAGTVPFVLTPHPGEAARLLSTLRSAEVDRAEVEAAPAAAATEIAHGTGAVVLLKGARTVVAGGGPLRVASAGVPWLATAGSGDVLAGVLGALLTSAGARAEAVGRPLSRAELADAAVAAAHVHGSAGLRAAGDAPGRPIVAGDVAAALPDVVADLVAGRDPAGEQTSARGGGILQRFGLR
ncbi:NAD(P)H-hydrate epimerase [Georgenia sp. Z1344]|uniref:NAD(P)H-hydrate epimerase n=1 Tax=Georgenia sp. Z1344 TaxID=3416706 RepID=UPI003CFA481E